MDALYLKPAKPLVRFGAVVIDCFVLALGFGALLLVGGLIGDAVAKAINLAFLPLVIAYEVLATNRYGKTVGKHLLKIEVTTDPAALNRPDIWNSFLRYVVKFVLPLYFLGDLGVATGIADTIYFVALIVVAGSVFSNENYRGFHDKIAGTSVVETPKRTRPSAGSGSTNLSL